VIYRTFGGFCRTSSICQIRERLARFGRSVDQVWSRHIESGGTPRRQQGIVAWCGLVRATHDCLLMGIAPPKHYIASSDVARVCGGKVLV